MFQDLAGVSPCISTAGCLVLSGSSTKRRSRFSFSTLMAATPKNRNPPCQQAAGHVVNEVRWHDRV